MTGKLVFVLIGLTLTAFVVDYKLLRVTKDCLFTRLLKEIGRHPDIIGIAAVTLFIENLRPSGCGWSARRQNQNVEILRIMRGVKET